MLVLELARRRPVNPRDLFAYVQRLLPLMLILVQLLQVHERVAVPGVEVHDFLERLQRAVDEPAVPVIEPQAEQDVGVLERREVPRQQRLVQGDGTAHLALLAVQVAENHLNLERVRAGARGLRELVDGLVHLVVHEEVQAEHVMRRLAQAAPIDPPAVPQLVPLPCLADGQPYEQGDQHGHEIQLRRHDSPCERTIHRGTEVYLAERLGAPLPRSVVIP